MLTANSASPAIPVGDVDTILCVFSGTFDGASAHVGISVDGEHWDSFFVTEQDDMKYIPWAPYICVCTDGGTGKTNIKALIARRLK